MKKRVLYISTARTMLAAELSLLMRDSRIAGGDVEILSESPLTAAEHHELVKRLRPTLVLLPHHRVGAPELLGFRPLPDSLQLASHERFAYDPAHNSRKLVPYRAAA